jgi:hypothetical protein
VTTLGEWTRSRAIPEDGVAGAELTPIARFRATSAFTEDGRPIIARHGDLNAGLTHAN